MKEYPTQDYPLDVRDGAEEFIAGSERLIGGLPGFGWLLDEAERERRRERSRSTLVVCATPICTGSCWG